ncbi:hypothetical protein PGT21_007905 [Puccinia graminis f. sp. tritici]|uniref:Uncharacterized protein n=1 Tax=Puccinia graminis f. sp. tritici TaxID=56615 RepID=A0A5B0MJQ1_PUCGR|nr:hypothetical protein PGT21_007905 [Puccinia graminis f. sp. tritici]
MSSGSESDRSSTQTPNVQQSVPHHRRTHSGQVAHPLPGTHTHASRARVQPYVPPLRGAAALAAANNGTTREHPRPGQATVPPAGERVVPVTAVSGGRRARPWPLNVVPFEVTEDIIDDEYFEQLGATYDLRAPYTFFAEELVQWVDCYFWLLVLDSRASKHKLEVTRIGEVVQNRSQRMNMKK